MRNYKKISLWAATALLTLSFGVWAYYVSINLKHIYNLIECSQGKYQIPLVPQHLCRAYLFRFRGSHDDAATINHDGSLVGLLSPASKEDQSRLLEFLLEKGVDINGLDERAGISPLHSAVLDNALEVVELLLHHGANPLIRDKRRNLTPLEFALQLKDKPGQPDRTAIIKRLEHAIKS
jgi:ankyrin repeat protein